VELDNWIKENHEKLDLKVRRFTWINEVLPGYFDYECSIDTDLGRFIGRGIADNEEKAFLKSFVEAIERWTCKFNQIPTEGVALHTDKEKALYYSFLEHYERVMAEKAYTAQAATVEMDLSCAKEELGLNLEALERKGICLKLFSCGFQRFRVYIAEAEVSGKSKKIFMGLGCKESHLESAMAAISEALMNAVAYGDNLGTSREIKLPKFWDEELALMRREPHDKKAHEQSHCFTDFMDHELKLPIQIPLYGYQQKRKPA